MKLQSRLGIWMDNANAYYTEFTEATMVTHAISSAYGHEQKAATLSHGEFTMHNKEQQMQTAYYRNIAAIIVKFTDVVLFGPTTAKVELFNILKADAKFDKVNIEYANADKMNEAHQHQFIKNYFKTN